jgi:hypothetical protein
LHGINGEVAAAGLCFEKEPEREFSGWLLESMRHSLVDVDKQREGVRAIALLV